MGFVRKLKLHLITHHEHAIARLEGEHWYKLPNTDVGPCMERYRALYFKDSVSLTKFLNEIPKGSEVHMSGFQEDENESREDEARRIVEIPHKYRSYMSIEMNGENYGKRARITFTTGISGERPSTKVEGDPDTAKRVMVLADRLCDPIPRFFGRNEIAVVEPTSNEEESANRRARILNRKGYVISAGISLVVSGIIPLLIHLLGA